MASIVERNHKFKVVFIIIRMMREKEYKNGKPMTQKQKPANGKRKLNISRSWELLWPLNVLICLNFLMNM